MFKIGSAQLHTFKSWKWHLLRIEDSWKERNGPVASKSSQIISEMSVKKVIENLSVAKTINTHCKQTKSLKYS